MCVDIVVKHQPHYIYYVSIMGIFAGWYCAETIHELLHRYFNNNWLFCIKDIHNKCGLSYIWHQQNAINVKWLEGIVNQILKTSLLKKWNSELYISSKDVIYRIFKPHFCCEDYLLSQKIRNLFVTTCSIYRTTNLTSQ